MLKKMVDISEKIAESIITISKTNYLKIGDVLKHKKKEPIILCLGVYLLSRLDLEMFRKKYSDTLRNNVTIQEVSAA